MGLAKALRWIEASGGSIRLESRPGQGTRAIVLLPAAKTHGACAVRDTNAEDVDLPETNADEFEILEEIARFIRGSGHRSGREGENHGAE